MSTTTTNFNLIKPELTDVADITATNGNWDTVDEVLGKTYRTDKKPTAADVGALALSGGVMTGQGFYINNKTNRIVGNQNGLWLRTASSDVDNNTDSRHFKVWNATYQSDLKKALALFDTTTGEDYLIYGQHNKPTFDDVGAVSIKKVWENAKPTSSFAAQTISLDLSEGDMVQIDYKATDTTSVVDSKIISVGNSAMLSTNYNNVSNSQAIVVASRSVTVSTTGIAFEKGFTKKPSDTASSENNARAIPVAVYVIKGVQK